jgi:methylase of polypeptide subunit release factors
MTHDDRQVTDSCPPPIPLDTGLLERLRGHLSDVGFGSGAPEARVLAQVFDLGLARRASLVREALGPVELEGLEKMGLLSQEGDLVSAPAQLTAVGDLLLASDRWTSEDSSAVKNFVIGVHAAAQSAANLSVRLPAVTALDIGTGTGIQALLASRHSDRVVGTDVNRRALRFATFNAALNGVRNVSFVSGSWFQPIRSSARFNFVVSNPPFVISPERAYLYRDGGLEADGASRLVVRGAAEHLAPGGFAHVMSDWVATTSAATSIGWAESVFGWTRASGCDTLVIRFSSRDAYEYACMWNDGLRSENPHEYDIAVRRWLDEFERLGIARIDSGIVVLRRSDGTNWQHALDAGQTSDGPAGAELLRIFAGQDLLHTVGDDDEQLLGLAYRLVEGHWIEQSFSFEKGVYVSHPAVVRVPGGSGLQVAVPVGALEAMFGCDGATPLEVLVGEHATERGIDAAWLRSQVADAARELLQVGLLEQP